MAAAELSDDSAAAHQVPGPGERVLDHVGLFVPDMDKGREALARLGFTLPPVTPQRHSLGPGEPVVPAGTANCTVMLRQGYVEMLAVVGEGPIADQITAAMKRYVGLHLIAFGSGDVEAEHARLADVGFEPAPVVRLQRTVGTPDGEAIAQFSVLRVPPGTHPEGRIQFCRHHTAGVVWQSRWIAHPNRAMALTHMALVVADPAEAAVRIGRFAGAAPARRTDGGWGLALDRGWLTFLDQGGAATLLPDVSVPGLPFMAAFALDSADTAETARVLRQADIVPGDFDGGLLVPPSPDLGCAIAFLKPSAPPPWAAI